MSYNLGLGDTDNINIDNQEVESLQLNSNIIWSKDNSPEWFNYTGIDASGNYEGTSAYDGTAVAYGIGKPTITTSSDGVEKVSWDKANGLNDEYFENLYGDAYIREWHNEGSTTGTQIVEDTLVIPDSHKGKPITTICPSAFYGKTNNNGDNYYYQPYFYKDIVWGKNITTICSSSFNNLIQMDRVVLPNTIRYMSNGSWGSKTYSNYKKLPIIEVNSNILEVDGVAGLYNELRVVIFNSGVTEIVDPLNDTLDLYATLVFKHSEGAQITITFNSKQKTAQAIDIYSDNLVVNNYDWSTNGNLTATIYPLSDYVEE